MYFRRKCRGLSVTGKVIVRVTNRISRWGLRHIQLNVISIEMIRNVRMMSDDGS